MTEKKLTIEDISTFCKKKGFAYPSSLVYGGLAGLYDYGHLGTLLKKNFEDLWRGYFLSLNDNFFEIEANEIMHENVFVASGHIKNFVDKAAKCPKGHADRADHLLERKTGKRFEGASEDELFIEIKKHRIKCPVCGLDIEKVETMNMMFPVNLGVTSQIKAMLRPETAQSPYVNYKIQLEVMRKKLPMGLALIGKAYRNEISPRNFILRQRAFTQAELQIFFNPSKIEEHDDFDSVAEYKLNVIMHDQREGPIQHVKCKEMLGKLPKFYVYHMAKVQQFYLDVLRSPSAKFRLYELDAKERAFYNKFHFDIEAELDSLGWVEIGGIHYRTDHDLKGHQEVSKESMEFLDEATKERFVPHVLELSFGVDRNFYSILNYSYDNDEKRGNVVLHLSPKLSPIKVGVFPLVSNKEELMKKAGEVHGLLRKEFRCSFDASGSIGRRYARSDEIGVPACVTIDFESLQDDCVTIRDRETTEQYRVGIARLNQCIKEFCNGESLSAFGRKI
jgi:glycyl-tRNA synthetase